jgi:hypothetical protein
MHLVGLLNTPDKELYETQRTFCVFLLQELLKCQMVTDRVKFKNGPELDA